MRTLVVTAMPKQVVTSTLHELGWNATALTGDVATAVGELKTGDGGPILWPAAPGSSAPCSTTAWSTSCGSWSTR